MTLFGDLIAKMMVNMGRASKLGVSTFQINHDMFGRIQLINSGIKKAMPLTPPFL
jgi:hypothetical protein